MDPSAIDRQKALPSISYSLNLLSTSDFDAICDIRSSADYHKANQALRDAQRAKHATKPWVAAPKISYNGQWTLRDKYVFSSAVSRHIPAMSTTSSSRSLNYSNK